MWAAVAAALLVAAAVALLALRSLPKFRREALAAAARLSPVRALPVVQALAGSVRHLPSARVVGRVGLRGFTPASAISRVGAGSHFARELVRLGGSGKAGVGVSADGLEGSSDWHRTTAPDGGVDKTGGVVTSRAVCINSLAHYEEMRVPLPSDPSTGENILVTDAFSIDTLCVGDVILVETTGEPVELTVTHVRRPCHRFAEVYDRATFTTIMQRGLAGVFCSVRRPGKLDVDGATLRVVARPHPAWPLRRLNALVYGASGWTKEPLWRGSASELAELIAVPELAEYQWKDHLRAVAAGG